MKSVIYDPPHHDLPYLVVTFDAGRFEATEATDRTEARRIAQKLSRKQKTMPREEGVHDTPVDANSEHPR
jgi:hypothetical protein